MQHRGDPGPLAAQANQTDRGTQESNPDHEPASAQDDMVEVPFGARDFPAFTCLAGEMRFPGGQQKKRICPCRRCDALLHRFLVVLDLGDRGEVVADSKHHEGNASNEQITFVQDAC